MVRAIGSLTEDTGSAPEPTRWLLISLIPVEGPVLSEGHQTQMLHMNTSRQILIHIKVETQSKRTPTFF